MKNVTRLLAILGVVYIIGVNTGLKLYSMPAQFPSEPFSVLGAIRLFYLPLFNFGAETWDSFFKSVFATSHGWNDFAYFYLVSAVYNVLHIPLSEVNYYYAMHFLGLLYLGLVLLIGWKCFDLTTGIFSSVLLSVSYFVVHASNCINHIMVTMFLEALLFLSAVLYVKNKELLGRRVFFAIMLFLSASLELIIFLPLVLLFEVMWPMHASAGKIGFGQSVKELIKPRHVLLWVPAIIFGLATFSIMLFFGDSNLGMWAYQKHAFPVTAAKLNGFLNFSNLVMRLNMRMQLNPPDFLAMALFAAIIIYIALVLCKKVRWYHPISFFIAVFTIACASNIATNRWKFYTANLPMGIIAAYGFSWLIRRAGNRKKLADLALALFIVVLAGTFVQQYHSQMKRKNAIGAYFFRPSPLKAAGYYIRHYGNRESTVFNLFRNVVYFDHTEYYYGKYIMSDNVYPKRNFSVFDYTPEEAKKLYPQVKEFDFYVTLESEPKEKALLNEGALKNLKKVADIYDGVTLAASVYSPHDYPYLSMGLDLYSQLWDKKYANLKNLFEHGRFGIVSLIGNRK